MAELRQRVGVWYREPELDYDDGSFREYAYEHDSGWMTVRIEGSDEHGWKVQGSTDWRNEIYIHPDRLSLNDALEYAYNWMENNSDISRWTRMDRASEYATSDKYDRTKRSGGDFDIGGGL